MKTRTLESTLSEFKGMTPDQIAQVVARRGIRGRMGTTYGCPMAILLNNTHTGAYVIGRKYIARRSGAVVERAATPRNVADFVRKFDIGGYPNLIAPPPRCVAPRGNARKGSKTSGPSGKRHPRVIKQHIAKLVGRFHESEAKP